MNGVRSRHANNVSSEAKFGHLDRADHVKTVPCPEPLAVPVESSPPRVHGFLGASPHPVHG